VPLKDQQEAMQLLQRTFDNDLVHDDHSSAALRFLLHRVAVECMRDCCTVVLGVVVLLSCNALALQYFARS
jgi:hypothetical protein